MNWIKIKYWWNTMNFMQMIFLSNTHSHLSINLNVLADIFLKTTPIYDPWIAVTKSNPDLTPEFSSPYILHHCSVWDQIKPKILLHIDPLITMIIILCPSSAGFSLIIHYSEGTCSIAVLWWLLNKPYNAAQILCVGASKVITQGNKQLGKSSKSTDKCVKIIHAHNVIKVRFRVKY